MKRTLRILLAGLAMFFLLALETYAHQNRQPDSIAIPNRKHTWIAGNAYTIRWLGDSIGSLDGKRVLKIFLQNEHKKNFPPDPPPKEEIPNNGSYLFRVKKDLPTGTYRIRMHIERYGWVEGDWFKVINQGQN